MHLSAGVLTGCNYFDDILQTVVEIKHADFLGLLCQFDLILLFNSSVVQEHGVSFLNLDEADMLVHALLYKRVSLVVLLHQHHKAAEGHTEHFSELSGVDCVLLGGEHAWL